MTNWRSGAKIVGVCDLLIAILWMTFCVWGALHAQTVVENLENGKYEGETYEERVEKFRAERMASVWIIFWVAVVIEIVTSCFHFYGAVRLLLATINVESNPSKSKRNARHWQIVTVLVLMFTLVTRLSLQQYPLLVISLLYRCVFIFIVHKFVKKLELQIGIMTQQDEESNSNKKNSGNIREIKY